MSKSFHPPKWANRFLAWFCSEDLFEEIAGDLHEAYQKHRKEKGKLKADIRYMVNVFKFFKPYSFEKYSRSKQYMPMFTSYTKVAFRNIIKRKYFSLVNTMGLSIGLTAVLLVGLYVHHELTYDTSFPESENVYRLVNQYRDQTYTCMSFGRYNQATYEEQLRLINQLKSYDGVVEACHFVTHSSAIGPRSKEYVRVANREFVRDDFLYTNTGAAFYAIFPQDFLIGSAESAFGAFNTVTLTEGAAATFFGKEWRVLDLLGQEVVVANDRFIIAGVIADVPGNVHFDFGMILHQQRIPSWGAYTYFKATKNVTGDQIVSNLNAEIDQVYPGYTKDPLSKGVIGVPLTMVHFTDGMLYELKAVANVQYLFTFGIVGLIILLIIWTNYANLSIAAYTGRQRELGVRKVMGAMAGDISFQLMFEALILTLLCFPVVWGLSYLILPAFNELLGIKINQATLVSPITLGLLFSVLVLTALVSSLYPALAYGQKSMLKLFSGKLKTSGVSQIFELRRVLLTSQFFLLITLMSLALIIMQQLNFIDQKPLGFNKEGVVFFSLDDREEYVKIKSQIESMPEVISVGNGIVPGADMYNQLTYQLRGSDEVFADGTHLYTSLGGLQVLGIDSDAFRLIEEGQDSIFIINQTAAKKLAIIKGVTPQELIGETLILEPEYENALFGNGLHYSIAAIIDDFDYFNLRNDAKPLLIEVRKESGWVYNMLIRLNTDNLVASIAKIEAAYLNANRSRPFDLNFLDSHLSELYEKERNAGRLTSGLTAVCIILSLMGLVGVVGFVTLTRQKEIGVRRVFGASVPNVLRTLSFEYVMMIFVATLLALPTAIFFGDRWLDSFAYRIDPSLFTVLLAGMTTLLIVLVVVVFQSYRAVSMNPVDALRYE